MTTEAKYKRDMYASIILFVIMLGVFLYGGLFGNTIPSSVGSYLGIPIIILGGLSRCLM